MSDLPIVIVMIVLGFSFLVFVHEFGHFIVGKMFGIRIHEFFLGFGPKLISKQIGETRYGIAAIPLGGYVKLSGMEEEGELSPEEEARSFRAQAKWKRILVILAGPLTNILFSIPLFMIVFLNIPNVVGTNELSQVVKGSPAQSAGIKAGDKVLEADGKKVHDFADLQQAIAADLTKPGRKIVLKIERGGEVKTITATLQERVGKDGKPQAPLGVGPKTVEKPQMGLAEAATTSVKMTYAVSGAILKAFGGLATGEVKPKQFADTSAGPIGIVSILGQGASKGVIDFLWLIAIIGPNLAIVNLFPLLPLDGGRIVIILYEGLMRRRPSKERIMQLQAAGFFLLLALIITLTVSDVGKLARGESFLGG